MINGNFDIWQRGTRQTRGGYGSADRWFVDTYNVNSLYMERVECTGLDPFAATYYARVGGVMADVYCYMFLQHRIENGFSTLRGKDATLSFWVRLSKPTVLEVTIRGTKFYYPKGGQYLRNLGTGWQKVVLHFDFKDCTEIGNARVYIGTPGDAYHAWGEAGGYMDIAQVQLEIGEVATEFEYRPIGLELMLCQRYYEQLVVSKSGGLPRTQGTYYEFDDVTYRVVKRKAPSITGWARYYRDSDCNHSIETIALYVNIVTGSNARIGVKNLPAGSYGYYAWVEVDAEL